MFARKQPEKTRLEQAIDKLLEQLVENDYDVDQTVKIVNQVTQLGKLREVELSRRRPSPDTILTVAGSVATIVLILGYERANVLTSKAVAFVLKLR